MTDFELVLTIVSLVGGYLSLVYCFLLFAQQAHSREQTD